MGLYGMSRIGNTLLYKGMCHELDGEYDGKVGHLQLGNWSEHLLLEEVLTTLTNINMPKVFPKIGKEKVLVLLSYNDMLDKLDFKPFNSWVSKKIIAFMCIEGNLGCKTWC